MAEHATGARGRARHRRQRCGATTGAQGPDTPRTGQAVNPEPPAAPEARPAVGKGLPVGGTLQRAEPAVLHPAVPVDVAVGEAVDAAVWRGPPTRKRSP